MAGRGPESRRGLAGDQSGRRRKATRAAGAGLFLEGSGPAPLWGASECGAVSSVLGSRHPQTSVGVPSPILNRRVWVAPLTVSKYFSGESDTRPGLKPSPLLPACGARRCVICVRVLVNPRLASYVLSFASLGLVQSPTQIWGRRLHSGDVRLGVCIHSRARGLVSSAPVLQVESLEC